MYAVVVGNATHLTKTFKSASRLAARFAALGMDALIVDSKGHTYRPVHKYPMPAPRMSNSVARAEAHAHGTVLRNDTGDHKYSKYSWTLP